MFLPLGDEPNPRGIPWTTYGLIAVNIAVYVLVTLPLSLARPDAGAPELGEYLRIILETLPPGEISAAQVVQQITAYDLFVFGHGFRPAAPEALALVTSMFPPWNSTRLVPASTVPFRCVKSPLIWR